MSDATKTSTKPKSAMRPQRLFYGPIPPRRKRRDLLTASFRAYGADLGERPEHDAFFADLFTPKSKRWAFRPLGQTGTSATFAALFALEFGRDLTTGVDDPGDLDGAAIFRRLDQFQVFRALADRADDVPSIPDYMDAATYVAVVEHPAHRAVSAFSNLCRSHELSHPEHAAQRVQLTAVTGFDWDKHPDTAEGFARFLFFIREFLEHAEPQDLSCLWRPQWRAIRPELFETAVIGKVEAFPQFLEALAEQLGGDPARARAAASTQGDIPRPALTEQAATWISATRPLLMACYDKDFEAFGYDL